MLPGSAAVIAERGIRAFRDGLVRRPALVERLLGAGDGQLALITAPAGYGKSTLIADWAESDDRPFVWVTLHPRENTTAAIAEAIVAAFEEASWAEPGFAAALSTSRVEDPSRALRRLMSSPTCRNRSFVLVLDDAHSTDPVLLRQIVAALLEHLGRGSLVALASRSEPAIPIGRLRARRSLVEVRMQDLAMSPAEAATLLQLVGVPLEFDEVQTLTRLTEGWPAALYLAALSLRDQRDTAAGLTRFRGDDHFISEYFRDEFLDQLCPEAMSFLTRASVLDELSGPLCDAVMERPSSAHTLAELARANPMIVPLGPSHDRYRWHALFRDAFQAELRRAEPQLARELRRRASTWYEQQGDVDRAIDLAFAAGDLDRAGDLLWANMTAYVAQGRNDAVQRWLATLSFAQIADYAPLAVVAAHSSLMTGDLNGAQHWGLAAAGALERGRTPKDASALRSGIELIRATAARVTPVEMGQAATRAYKREPENSQCRAMCCLLKGAAEHLLEHRESAKQHLEEGVETGIVGAPMVAALCLAQLVIIAVDEEDMDTSIELGDQAAAVVRKSGIAQDPIAAIVFAASAAATAQQGRADEAKRDLRHGAYLVASLGEFIPWYGVEARLLLARAALGVADTVRARTLLSEASRLARRTPEVASFRRRFDELWAQIDALAESALSGPSSLTIAELRILRFLPSHRSFREIAERLDVSVNTVKTHAHGIYRKLDAASRSEAVARASEAGLLGT